MQIDTQTIRGVVQVHIEQAIVSGDIHRQLGMKDGMPLICSIMYEEKMPGDEVLQTTPSDQSSTIKIRYDLRNR